jgi:hypothetical protein
MWNRYFIPCGRQIIGRELVEIQMTPTGYHGDVPWVGTSRWCPVGGTSPWFIHSFNHCDVPVGDGTPLNWMSHKCGISSIILMCGSIFWFPVPPPGKGGGITVVHIPTHGTSPPNLCPTHGTSPPNYCPTHGTSSPNVCPTHGTSHLFLIWPTGSPGGAC